MHAVPKAHQQREQVRHWSWIWATVTAALQAQAQNLMHWTALGLGVGIAAYFGVSREPGAAVFLAVSLSASLCAVLAVRLRNGIARLLIVIAGVAVAITVGDRMYLDRDVQQTLRAANLSHLLAISGLHMGLLTSRVFFFFASSYVLPSLSDLKLANQENRGIDQHGSWGGISTAVWGQCCIRACIYYGLYHLRSRAVRVAPGHVVSAFNSGNFGFATSAGSSSGARLSNVFCGHWALNHRV